jgi:arylsulfatase A-like enzyme
MKSTVPAWFRPSKTGAVFRVLGRSLFFAFVLVAMIRGDLAAAAELQPNIVFILADDLGYGDLSCYGGRVPTPNLDQLAREGTRFTQAYVASPICSPSRAALITGQHPGRWRITSYLQTRKGNQACEMADYLDPQAPSLPRALQGAGYRTAHVGKWHLGGGRDVTNAPAFKEYGYDIGFGTYESPEPHPEITATNWIWSNNDPVKRWERTKWMVDRSFDFLRAERNKPAFINLWLDDPHTPWVPSEAESNKRGPESETRQNLRQVLMEMDRQIGRLMGGIREMKSERETVVIFMSDNGPLPTFNQSRTAGLRGSKLSLYEGGIRVPMIAWWPGRIPAARVDEKSVISSLDMFPTFAELAGMKLPVDIRCEGQNMVAALCGRTAERTKPLFWEYGRNASSFAYPREENRSPNVAIREGKWKLLLQAEDGGSELYNLEKDPAEKENVAKREPSRVARMAASALEWRKSLP